MAFTLKSYAGHFRPMVTKVICEQCFTSWRTLDNKYFFIVPTSINLNLPKYGISPRDYLVSYVLLGQLDMVY